VALDERTPEAASMREHNCLALRLRLAVAITNYERGDNPENTVITV
jgi:hypothetical protein